MDDHQKVAPSVDESSTPRDLARTALDRARGIGRPARRRSALARRPSSGGYTAAGQDARDPQPAAALLGGLIDEQGWQRPLAEARVFADWVALVGADVAAHCRPVSLRTGELRLAAESTAWATQLRMMVGTLLARLVGELGPDVVTKVLISGPVAPSWKHGGLSVRGARGPRDTYG